jgi:hypothetical protein
MLYSRGAVRDLVLRKPLITINPGIVAFWDSGADEGSLIFQSRKDSDFSSAFTCAGAKRAATNAPAEGMRSRSAPHE